MRMKVCVLLTGINQRTGRRKCPTEFYSMSSSFDLFVFNISVPLCPCHLSSLGFESSTWQSKVLIVNWVDSPSGFQPSHFCNINLSRLLIRSFILPFSCCPYNSRYATDWRSSVQKYKNKVFSFLVLWMLSVLDQRQESKQALKACFSPNH